MDPLEILKGELHTTTGVSVFDLRGGLTIINKVGDSWRISKDEANEAVVRITRMSTISIINLCPYEETTDMHIFNLHDPESISQILKLLTGT